MVKHFSCGYENGMYEYQYGNYVRAEDYHALQAKLDAVMLEYCPEEMTSDQLAEWAAHQNRYDI